MRTHIKKQLIDLLDSMSQLQSSLSVTMDKEQTIQLLADCQGAAVAVGEALERDSDNHESIISLLEEYCEETFYLSQLKEDVIFKKKLSLLAEIINTVRVLLKEISTTYQVVFMPYKASMWDSLESIWRACKEDERCECHVMPIPYYEFDSKANRWIYCYEGEQFSDEVPIVHYQNYSFEQSCPDVAYIHNPYDDWNLVTRVEPRFYSTELKKHIRKLVYVPYYVTCGFIAQEQLVLPVYQNMDYMVVQSEYAKSFCEGMYYYDKILPFGSPKLDGVIRLCQKGTGTPESWKPLLEGKRTLMLNTSIGCFLFDGSAYLEKIKSLCRVIGNQDKVALIWRPHPLLEATIKSMRPHLLPEYISLKEYFLDNKIGVLDETPDISRTVGIADGYIGEEGSSVINLFGAAGKPIFILDNYITNVFAREEKFRVHITDMTKQENRLWILTNRYNALFSMDLSTKQVHYAGRVENQPKWHHSYPFFAEAENKLFLSPNIARRPAVYDISTKAFSLIGEEDMKESALRGRSISFGEGIFYLPLVDDYIAEFNIHTGEWKYHTECIQKLSDGVEKDNVIKNGMTFDVAVYGKDMWVSANYTNRVLRFNMEDGTYSICTIGSKESGYSGIAAEERFLWLTEVNSGNIIRWERRSGKVKSYGMPEGFLSWSGPMDRKLPHRYLIDMGEWVITVPGYSNCMVKLDKVSGKVTMFMKDFWNGSEKKKNGYAPGFHISSDYGAKLEVGVIIVQRRWDDATAVVHVEDETYEIFYPTLKEADFLKLTEGEDGFEKTDEKSGFFRRESKIFSFEGFIDDLVHDRLAGVRERQLNELSTLATNLDGTCGIKVHEYMMNVLENKDNQ